MAIANRNPGPEQTVIHSDHGWQDASWAFTQRAREPGLLPSMGTIGDADDDAVTESFWARIQTELLDRQRWTTRLLEVFHNRQRRHSALGWRTLLSTRSCTPPTSPDSHTPRPPSGAQTRTNLKESGHDGVEGFIVPARDSEALAHKVEILAEDSDLRLRMVERPAGVRRSSTGNALKGNLLMSRQRGFHRPLLGQDCWRGEEAAAP
jgi:hypothetical protein